MNRLLFGIVAFSSLCMMALSASAGGYGYERHSGHTQQMQDACVKPGWMDNDTLQRWRAKHPGKDLCFSNRSVKRDHHYQKQDRKNWQSDRHAS